MGSTSSPNRSSSMLGMAAPNGPMWSSSIMGILEEVICERRLLPGTGRRAASDWWLLVWSAWGQTKLQCRCCCTPGWRTEFSWAEAKWERAMGKASLVPAQQD